MSPVNIFPQDMSFSLSLLFSTNSQRCIRIVSLQQLQARIDVPMREFSTGDGAITMRKSASDSSMQFAKTAANKAANGSAKSPGVVKRMLARSPFAKRSPTREVPAGPCLSRKTCQSSLVYMFRHAYFIACHTKFSVK